MSTPKLRVALGYAGAAAGVAGMTLLLSLVPGAARVANLSLLYLLVVIVTALRWGSGPAVAASVLSFLAFDWFFVEPRLTFTVSDPAEWLALLMYLVTAITTGQLTALLRRQAEEARRRERETAALAEASWAVSSQVERSRALAEVLHQIGEVIPAAAAAILACGPDAPRVVADTRPVDAPPETGPAPASDPAVEYVLAEGKPVAWGGDRHHWEKAMPGVPPGTAYLPLSVEHQVLGVLRLRLPPDYAAGPAERRVVDSLANQAAIVLERDRLMRGEAEARALREADRLKTALLSMISHDFRSPLASIKASATALLQGERPMDPETQRELQLGIIQEADRLNAVVGNILALSRLEADAWTPRKEEVALSEVVEAARAGFTSAQNNRIRAHVDESETAAWMDPVQIGQVLHNLLDNALKYSPAGTKVELRAMREDDGIVIEVRDRGPGLPPNEEGRIFERFYRAPLLRESSVPGVGIGLSVCRGLVEAHGGTLTATNREGGGAMFRVALPLRPES